MSAGKIKIGTDICFTPRVEKAYRRFGARFLERVLTSAERLYVESHPQLLVKRLAGRFAVKEAASKVLGTGWHGISWKDIEVVKESSGAPSLRLHGRASKLACQMGLSVWEVTLSHDGDYATAFVLAHG